MCCQFSTWGRHVALGLLLGTIIAGCRSEVSAQQTSLTATPEVAAAQVPVVPLKGQSKFDEAAFQLEVKAPQTLKVGSPGDVVIALQAKAPFHVNLEYPHRFKVASVSGGKAAATTVTRDPSKVSAGKLELVVSIIPTQTGSGTVQGEFAFSLCTDEKCLMEKRQLKGEFLAN